MRRAGPGLRRRGLAAREQLTGAKGTDGDAAEGGAGAVCGAGRNQL